MHTRLTFLGQGIQPPRVHGIQPKDMKVTHLADDFVSFVRGLKTEEEIAFLRSLHVSRGLCQGLGSLLRTPSFWAM